MRGEAKPEKGPGGLKRVKKRMAGWGKKLPSGDKGRKEGRVKGGVKKKKKGWAAKNPMDLWFTRQTRQEITQLTPSSS